MNNAEIIGEPVEGASQDVDSTVFRALVALKQQVETFLLPRVGPGESDIADLLVFEAVCRQVDDALEGADGKLVEANGQERLEMASHMALWAFRYALGRMSYCPGMVQDELRHIWRKLGANERHCIVRDLDEEIARANRGASSLGMECDRQGWITFFEWATSEDQSTASPPRKCASQSAPGSTSQGEDS